MVSEFERLNAEKPKVEVQSSAIDLLFNKVNDYHNNRNYFYENIKENNMYIDNLSYDAMCIFTKKVKELFKNYNVSFLENKDSLQIMAKSTRVDGTFVVLSFRITYVTHWKKYDEQSSTVCSRSNFDIIIDTKTINHRNFLECPVFLKAVENMFLKYPQIKKINN